MPAPNTARWVAVQTRCRALTPVRAGHRSQSAGTQGFFGHPAAAHTRGCVCLRRGPPFDALCVVAEELRGYKGIIISGGPQSVYGKDGTEPTPT